MNLNIINYKIKEVDFQDPIKIFKEYANGNYNAILTGNGLSDLSQFSFIGLKPHTKVKYLPDKIKIENSKKTITKKCENFWLFFKEILQNTNFETFPYPINLCGGIGYLSYELLHKIEKVKKLTTNNYNFPYFEIVFYNEYLIFENHLQKAYKIRLNYEKESIIENHSCEDSKSYQIENVEFESNKDEYIRKVEKIQKYIRDGDVYEVNLTQQISGDFSGSAFSLFEKLYSINDAPFSGYLNFGKNKIICNSPESYLRAFDKKIETRPIKGTVPRGKNEKEDLANRQELLNSKKDQAELFMIIDLLRNDIGKVCKYGSVEVKESKRLEQYNNVYHLVGIIEGILRKENDYIDLIRATFPGGSITGCPKIRCMEIIEELETYSRNLYTGSIFLLNKDFFNSNIVIRTAIIQDQKIYINSGGAITIDSNPENEYNELIHKIKNILAAGGFNYDNLLL